MPRHKHSSAFRAGLLLSLAFPLMSACGGGGGNGDGESGSSGGSGGGSSGGTTPSAVSYKVLATNDLGMHCVDKDFSVFSLLPPFNVVDAQVVRTDSAGKPSLLSGSAVELRYAAVADADGSINSRSVGKTNFWQFARQLFGTDLAPGEGLTGLYMPGEAPGPAQASLAWDSTMGLYKAAGVPIIPVDDAGHVNRFPLMRINALDASNGATLASLDVVLPVSEETTCSDCHATGQAAAKSAGIAWSAKADVEVQSRENVLLLHDARNGTNLMAARPVLCASCHYSAALDLAGSGPTGAQAGLPTMSAAMHAFHSDKMRDASGVAYADRWVTQGEMPPSPDRQACYTCHPGRETRCLRGAMTDTVSCQNCHGKMDAVGRSTRRPWVDLPRCQSCHTGDAVQHLTLADASLMSSDGLRTLVAFDPADATAPPRQASGSRFAEATGKLYRFSKGHGGIACEGCHNSTHAIWPNATGTHNDNVAPAQLQGHAGTLIECTACHGDGTLPMSLGGPHGMHPVGDSRWTSGGHESAARSNRQACAACHGTDFRGTPLSRTAATRVWRSSRTVAQGTEVGCYDCHNGPGG
jgi:hypothetical protein